MEKVHWKDNSSSDDLYSIAKKAELDTDLLAPFNCPLCRTGNVHYFFSRDKRDSSFGGSWVWCSNCRHSSHARALIPEWWEDDNFAEVSKLNSLPDYLETMKIKVDSHWNLLAFKRFESNGFSLVELKDVASTRAKVNDTEEKEELKKILIGEMEKVTLPKELDHCLKIAKEYWFSSYRDEKTLREAREQCWLFIDDLGNPENYKDPKNRAARALLYLLFPLKPDYLRVEDHAANLEINFFNMYYQPGSNLSSLNLAN